MVPPPPHLHTFQVLTTLGYLMEPVPAPLQPFSRWYRLTRRRSSDRISGEIMVIVGVMPGYVHDAVRCVCGGVWVGVLGGGGRSSDRISGEIMVIVGVMPGYVHDAVRGGGGR